MWVNFRVRGARDVVNNVVISCTTIKLSEWMLPLCSFMYSQPELQDVGQLEETVSIQFVNNIGISCTATRHH